MGYKNRIFHLDVNQMCKITTFCEYKSALKPLRNKEDWDLESEELTFSKKPCDKRQHAISMIDLIRTRYNYVTWLGGPKPTHLNCGATSHRS